LQPIFDDVGDHAFAQAFLSLRTLRSAV